MGHKFATLVFTPQVLKIQAAEGSRARYERLELAALGQVADDAQLGQREADFIRARDSFYMASTSETGWPYVQHRGGPAGFMKVLDAHTIGFADYSGNRQYVSTGNLAHDDRVALIFVDYPNRRRLKLLGHACAVAKDDSETMERLRDPTYQARIERGFIIQVEATDWNCPQHITRRFSPSP